MMRTRLEICQEHKFNGLFFLLFQAWGQCGVALILWKKRSATTGCASTPSQSANSILEDWVMLIAIPGELCQKKRALNAFLAS
jgi:disulfide bond formation protein DsbB